MEPIRVWMAERDALIVEQEGIEARLRELRGKIEAHKQFQKDHPEEAMAAFVAAMRVADNVLFYASPAPALNDAHGVGVYRYRLRVVLADGSGPVPPFSTHFTQGFVCPRDIAGVFCLELPEPRNEIERALHPFLVSNFTFPAPVVQKPWPWPADETTGNWCVPNQPCIDVSLRRYFILAYLSVHFDKETFFPA